MNLQKNNKCKNNFSKYPDSLRVLFITQTINLKRFYMKMIMIMIFCLLGGSINAQVPPKKANKIIVLAKDSANILLDRIAGVLYDKGFVIENKDEKVKFISTKDLASKKWVTIYKIKARINDTAIIFTGQIAFNKDTDFLGIKETTKTYWDIDYSGSKNSSMREAWNIMDAIAKQFGDKIIYSKQ